MTIDKLEKKDVHSRILNKWNKYKELKYVNTHNYQFTPESFCSIIRKLNELSFTNFKVHSHIPTIKNTKDFFIILEKENEIK